MEKNYAIVIGVSEFDHAGELPGSKNDAYYIHSAIQASGKYDGILYLNENVNSENAKDDIVDFIEKINGDVGEILFYFSGHGAYIDEDFKYVLSDYRPDRINQTTLSNNTLDNYFRQLNSKVVVKCIDACQSGTTYVKDPSVVEKYLHKTKAEFNHAYFLYSSRRDQSSYADREISFFTRSILECLADSNGKKLRYTRLIEYLADAFKNNPDQTPYFVTQGGFTEIFLEITNDLFEKVKQFIQEIEDGASTGKQISIQPLIEDEKENYLTEDEAKSYVGAIYERIEKYDFDPLLSQLFDIKIIKISNDELFSVEEAAAEYLLFRVESDFFNVDYSTTVVERKNDSTEYIEGEYDGKFLQLRLNLPSSSQTVEYDVKSFKLNTDFDKGVEIQFVPKHLNIVMRKILFTIIPSHKGVFINHATVICTRKSWSEFVDQPFFGWKTRLIEKGEGIPLMGTYIDEVMKAYSDSIQSPILAKLIRDNEE